MMPWIIGACGVAFVLLAGLIGFAVIETQRNNAALAEPFEEEAGPEDDPAPPHSEPFYGFKR